MSSVSSDDEHDGMVGDEALPGCTAGSIIKQGSDLGSKLRVDSETAMVEDGAPFG